MRKLAILASALCSVLLVIVTQCSAGYPDEEVVVVGGPTFAVLSGAGCKELDCYAGCKIVFTPGTIQGTGTCWSGNCRSGEAANLIKACVTEVSLGN